MDDKIELTESELGYLAGLIDGEGCINIRCTQDRYYSLQVITAQANEELLVRWRDRTGLGTVHRLKRSGDGNWAAMWQWNASFSHAEKLIELVGPYLVLKADEARIALEFVAECRRQQHQFRGKGAPRLTDEMLNIRQAYMDALKELKTRRNGASMNGGDVGQTSSRIDIPEPEVTQLTLF